MSYLRSSDFDQRNPTFGKKVSSSQANITISYQVTIATEPGNGEYEATIKAHPQSDKKGLEFEISGQISRVNLYGHDADCIVNIIPALNKFCYCRNVTNSPVVT